MAITKQPKKVPGLYLRPDGLYEKIIRIDGKRVYFRSKDPREVYQKMATYEEKKEIGAYFEDIAEQWELEHLPTVTHNTKKGYMPAYRRVKEKFGTMPVKNITPQEINNYVINFSKNRAYKTTANELLVLRMILDFACLKNEIQSNPALHVKVPKGLSREPRRFPTDKEIQIVKDSVHKDYGLLYYFVLYSGARLGEALALQWKDIDFTNKQIHISKSVYYVSNQPQIKTPKTASGKRDVILLDRLANALEEHKIGKEEYIFAEGGRIPSRTMVHRGKERYQRQTGIDITPHQLRHAFATMLFEAGIDEKTAQYLLGHAQISTTMDIYTELRKQKLIEAAHLLENFDIDTVSTQ